MLALLVTGAAERPPFPEAQAGMLRVKRYWRLQLAITRLRRCARDGERLARGRPDVLGRPSAPQAAHRLVLGGGRTERTKRGPPSEVTGHMA